MPLLAGPSLALAPDDPEHMRRMFHGTTLENALAINKVGFRLDLASSTTCGLIGAAELSMGDGVYAFPEYEYAKLWAQGVASLASGESAMRPGARM